MNEILLVTFIIITVIALGGLVWLILEHKKLKKDYFILNEHVHSNNQDIAGLCSAAVFVDSRISENVNRLKSIVDKIVALEEEQREIQNQQQVSTNESYQNEIKRVQNGVESGEQSQHYEVSREEAELLIRLQGKR